MNHLRSFLSSSRPISKTNLTASKMAATKISADSFLALIKNRRTYYPLSKDVPISNARVQEIVTQAVLNVPSSWNSQSNRVVVLFGEEHHKFWDITTDTLKAIVPDAQWQPTADKMAMFRGAAGTIMLFDDQAVVEHMQSAFPTYAHKFPGWADDSSAMLQFTLWVALEAEGLGANLQHYNPIVDAKVAETWKLPSTWKLNAQLVFGGKTGEAGEKTFKPVEELMKVFNS
jgi:uncharacterized protein